jgi:glycosyltransferase involved in cell wall biosynthesis
MVPALFTPNGGVVGGAERYAFELARHMSARVPTTLVTFGEDAQTETADGLTIQVIGKARYIKAQRSNPIAIRPLLSLLRNADVVHCHQQYVTSSSLAALFCRLTGRRVFVSELGGGGWDISSYISTDSWYHGHLHISQYSRKMFKQEHARNAHVIFGGVDLRKFSPDQSVPKSKTVLFVGRLLPHKGINYLIEALPRDMCLEMIGQPYDGKFFAELQRLSAGKNVVFRHDCTDDQLVNAYRRSLCVVLPSVYKNLYGGTTNVPELLGQTLLEGMACGIPAICSDVASMPEIVEDGVSGFVVPPNDPKSLREKLVWLRDNPESAAQMGRRGSQRVTERFNWSAVVQSCLKIYKSP